MPQFDIYSFTHQIHWFSLFILIYFFLMFKYIIPSISISLKFRTKYNFFIQSIFKIICILNFHIFNYFKKYNLNILKKGI